MRSQSSGKEVDILEAFLGARGARGARSKAAGDRVRRGPATLGPHVRLHHSAPTHVLKSENETVDVRVALPVQCTPVRNPVFDVEHEAAGLGRGLVHRFGEWEEPLDVPVWVNAAVRALIS